LSLVEEPQAVNEPVELVEIALGHPVAPGETQVVDLSRDRGQGGVAFVTRDVLPLQLSEVCEVGGVRAASVRIELG
jgi:hypothetical protein